MTPADNLAALAAAFQQAFVAVERAAYEDEQAKAAALDRSGDPDQYDRAAHGRWMAWMTLQDQQQALAGVQAAYRAALRASWAAEGR